MRPRRPLFRGQTSGYTGKFRLHLNNKKAKGTFTFASVSKDSSVDISVTADHSKNIKMAQNVADKPISALMEGDEAVASIHKVELTGDSFTVNYEGSTSGHFLLNALKFLLPLVLLLVAGILVYVKQNSVLYWLKRTKEKIQEQLKKFQR